MKLKIYLDLDNDAFSVEFKDYDEPEKTLLNIVEVRRCLNQVISGIGKTTSGKIMDSNGNSVGYWKVVK